MLICGIDFETTGLKGEEDRIIEIGAVLWDTDTKTPVRAFSTLCKMPDYPALTEEITRITGITPHMLDQYSMPTDYAFRLLEKMCVDGAEMFVAHNAPFDKKFYEAQCGYMDNETFRNIPWACSMADVPYGDKIKGQSLIHVSAEHGFVNPFSHRALFDVMSMLRVVSEYDIEVIRATATTEKILVRCMATYNERELAKKLKFRWDGEKKWWTKHIPETLFDNELNEAKKYNLDVRRIYEKDN